MLSKTFRGRIARNSLYVAAAAASIAAATAQASTITFFGSSGTRAASAKFEAFGQDLVITLTNTSSYDVLFPTEVLTALYFDVQSGPPLDLSRESALVGPGSTVLFGPAPGGVVGGEWAYEQAISGPHGQAYGVSSTGLDIFGASNRFPGPNLQGPEGVDGLQYGITSAADDATTGNTPVTGPNALIRNQVVFTLSGLPVGFDPAAQIKKVLVQYGTDPSEPQICLVPEPGTLALMVLGAVTLLRRIPLAR